MEDNNDMRQKDNIRIDMYRVNNKILAQYKADSPERRKFILAKKLAELKQATDATYAIPPEIIGLTTRTLKYEFTFGLIKASAAWVVFVLALLSFKGAGNDYGKVAFGALGAAAVFAMFQCLRESYKALYDHRVIIESLNKAEDNLKRLLDEVKELGE